MGKSKGEMWSTIAWAIVLGLLLATGATACHGSDEDGDDDDDVATDDDTSDDDGGVLDDDDDDDDTDDDDDADDDDDDDTADDDTDTGPWSYEVSGGSLAILYDGETVFTMTGVSSLAFTPDIRGFTGSWDFFKKKLDSTAYLLAEDGESIVVRNGAIQVGTITPAETEAGNYRVDVHLEPGAVDQAVELAFAMGADDRFWGFGEQYSFVDFRGMTVPIWVQEQGLGRAPDPAPILPIGKLTDSYFPMPYFMDPEAGRGFLLENSQYSEFDLGETQSDEWSVEVWDTRDVSFLVLPGPKPLDVVTELTDEVGRAPSAPPDWAFEGVWLAAQGGTDEVADRVEEAQDADIPVTAVWVQDWLGLREFTPGNFGVKYHWTHDDTLYPDLDDLIDDLSGEGVRFLGYFNPFVVDGFDQWDEGVEEGYVVLDPDDDPYEFLISTFSGGLVDVFNADAGEWFQGFAETAIDDFGQKGWMADFGEWLPYDAKIATGEATALHNLYPQEWHRLNREVLEDRYPDGDWVMFTRSGFTGDQKYIQVMWAGDQEATWDEYDGIGTVVTAGLTSGMMGIGFFTHDIAGFSGGPSTKELYQRWTEMGAFTPIMRTHDGLKKLENHRWDTDEETTEHFALFSRIHEALAPYFISLQEDVLTKGWPMIRHTVMVDPEWATAYDAHGQWMIGEDMIVVPVVEQGADQVTVHFPEGDWEHLLTGDTYDGRTTATVDAPIGTPAVFVRDGFDGDIVDAVRALYDAK
ncbi:MAG: hypothetical protein H6685_04940 [Deltaproteobacteria bacterium]|nr:hypothetical protein [Deltaproteobacteria bacterium]